MINARRDLLVSGSAATALATGSLVASDDAKAQAQPTSSWSRTALSLSTRPQMPMEDTQSEIRSRVKCTARPWTGP
jgi:hypothetical protein